MIAPLITASVFAVVFVGELPDKTAVACLVLGARYRPVPVLLGVGAAFVLHVLLAVTLGGLLAELPHRPVQLATGLLFLLGALLLLRADPATAAADGEANAASVTAGRGTAGIAAGAFGVVLVAEFGDVTQILTATLAARYGDPVSVGVGAVLALWSVAALAVFAGRRLLRHLPLRRVQQAAALLLLGLAALAVGAALRG